MLVLSRKRNESVTIRVAGHEITVVLLEPRHDRARIGFDAPPEVVIHRTEIMQRIDAAEGTEGGEPS